MLELIKTLGLFDNFIFLEYATFFAMGSLLVIKLIGLLVVSPMKKRHQEATKNIDSTYRRFQSIESRELNQIRKQQLELSRELAEQRQLNAELRQLLRKQKLN